MWLHNSSDLIKMTSLSFRNGWTEMVLTSFTFIHSFVKWLNIQILKITLVCECVWEAAINLFYTLIQIQYFTNLMSLSTLPVMPYSLKTSLCLLPSLYLITTPNTLFLPLSTRQLISHCPPSPPLDTLILFLSPLEENYKLSLMLLAPLSNMGTHTHAHCS